MSTNKDAYAKAQEGLHLIEDSIIRLLESNPQGLRNAQIADLLGLRSDFRGSQRNYLTYSVLGGLIHKEKIRRDDETKLIFQRMQRKRRANRHSQCCRRGLCMSRFAA